MKPIKSMLKFKRWSKPLGWLLVLTTLIVLSLAIWIPRASAGPGYDLNWWTVDDGGVVELSNGGYSLSGGAGQADAATWQGGNYSLAGGFWVFGPQQPTAVTVTDLQVEVYGRAFQIHWQTALEIDLVGFNLLRSSSPDEPGQPLNAALIPAQGWGGGLGSDYAFVDANLTPGQTYYYWLEIVEVNRTAIYGPLEATAPLVILYIPMAQH